ncbi:MAG: GNAT family N-acetyltransferase, partial [Betaproteobacteria bacterium]|nr:GNAT family N-acetyltransferase [Betaproteobacteria bacterium]
MIAAIHAASWKVAYRGLYADRYLDHEVAGERRRHWRKRVPELLAGDGEIFLAQIDGRAVGFICIELGTDREWGAYVDNLHVLPAWRGANVGGALLERGAAWARARGQKQLWLWVFERNHAARRFYDRA